MSLNGLEAEISFDVVQKVIARIRFELLRCLQVQSARIGWDLLQRLGNDVGIVGSQGVEFNFPVCYG